MIAVGKYRKGSVWYIYWSKNGKKHSKTTGHRDEGNAEKERKAKERELNDGATDFRAELLPLVDEWVAALEAAGDTTDHIKPSKARLTQIITRLGWHSIGDMDDAEAEQFIGGLPLAGRTKNGYRQVLTSFGNFLRRKKAIKANPFLSICTWEVHRTRKRRRLTDAEWQKLMKAAPADRRMLYRLAACTGLRRGELAMLCPGDLTRDGHLLLDSQDTKNRNEVRQPMPDEELAALKRYIKGKPADQPIWPGLKKKRTAEVLRRDLAKAKVPYKTREGVFDFHALRVQYISQLAIRGVPLAMAQQLARHSSPQLTSTIYSKFAPEEKVEAVRNAFKKG